MNQYFIGLMSGTSLDGIDAVLVDFSENRPRVVGTHYEPYTPQFKRELDAVCYAEVVDVGSLGYLDARLGEMFALCATALLEQNDLSPGEISAIGCHGQTLHHCPNGSFPYSLQIGDPNRIAELTGITTIADFRRRDIAAKGQGAPLAPAFHQAVFQSSEENRVILNIGGIANLTVLPNRPNAAILGFDSGPGNTLLDYWIKQWLAKPMDENGEWAKSGRIHKPLLDLLLSDPYFQLPPPKSTGQEYFSPDWLAGNLAKTVEKLLPEDVQATLCQLTVDSVGMAIRRYAARPDHVFVCGGGVHNGYLLSRLRAELDCPLQSTEILGIHPDWVEAIAFAWLARQTLCNLPGNVPAVTGARHPVILGGIYPGRGTNRAFSSAHQVENDEPQPQVVAALGLRMTN
jgi:anhydro-N-acetylmuramic acid kinase